MTFMWSIENITAWLTGMLAISSAIMCIGLWPIIRTEFSDSRPWYNNKALRLSAALFIHGAGALILFASVLFPPAWSIVAYLAWMTLALWLFAKILIISVSGRLSWCIALFTVWTGVCITWVLFE